MASQFNGLHTEDPLDPYPPAEGQELIALNKSQEQTPFRRCCPSSSHTYPCSFIQQPLLDYKQAVEENKLPYASDALGNPEFFDWFEEFPTIVIPKGTTLVHVGNIDGFLRSNDNWKTYSVKSENDMCWWNKTFVGQKAYKGGWFTYEHQYGGPIFQVVFKYRTLKDLPILFIPNNYDQKYEQNHDEFFAERYEPGSHMGQNLELYKGSHLIKGVRGWNRKRYPKLKKGYYADGLALRLADLGFNGYISCDECEVYITHKAMESVLERPYEILVNVNAGDYTTDLFNTIKSVVESCEHISVKLNITSLEQRSTAL